MMDREGLLLNYQTEDTMNDSRLAVHSYARFINLTVIH
jgi:hypothetical protein